MNLRAASFIPIVLLLAGGALNGVQAPQSGTLRVEVSLVTVGVRVTDTQGRAVSNLGVNDFTLHEDGVKQPIALFSSEEQPINLGILLDRSTSMDEGYKIVRAKAAAQLLVDAAHPGTECLYVAFNHTVWFGAEFTQDLQSVKREIAATSIGGGTSFYDAILYALERCKRAKYGRQALVVITDGADQHSSHSLDDVTRALQESQVQLYTIGYYSRKEETIYRNFGPRIDLDKLWSRSLAITDVDEVKRRGGVGVATSNAHDWVIDNPIFVFKRLAKESGAESFFPRSDKELHLAAEKIAKDLQTQYTLSYYPSNASPDGRYRQIKVKVRPPGLKVRAREGYILRPPNK